jgi:hypothetical protein
MRSHRSFGLCGIAIGDRDRDFAMIGGISLLRRGNRLSVMPVSAEHWEYVLGLE